MATGWVRAYAEELEQFSYRDRDHDERDARAAFRESFTTVLREAADDAAAEVRELRWGDSVDLPDGISNAEWTAVSVDGDFGFIKTAHLVEVAYVSRRDEEDGLKTRISYERSRSGGGTETVHKELIWGDCVQILQRNGAVCHARGRSIFGDVPAAHLVSEPLMEVYFVDVGQGDGVLVRTPDARHILVDGGARARQATNRQKRRRLRGLEILLRLRALRNTP